MPTIRKIINIIIFLPSLALAHGGGLDAQGGHRDRQAGTYHFHKGQLDGKTFSSKEAGIRALEALESVGVYQTDVAAPSVASSVALFNLEPFRPYGGPVGQIISHRAYALRYSEAHEQAAWVLYRITAEQLRASVDRTDDFRADRAVTTGSASLDDYRGSGYDRGHMAPAAAMAWSEEVMSESFLLSNISPQEPDFNRGIWRELEARVRNWARRHNEILVVTGPVLSEQLPRIGPNKVAVPDLYYKVVVDLAPPGISGVGFILPNGSANEAIDRYVVSIDSVEAITGMDFFPVVVDSIEAEVEGMVVGEHWGLKLLEFPTWANYKSWGRVKAE